VIDGRKPFILPAESLSVFSDFFREDMGMTVDDHGFFSHRPRNERNERMEKWNAVEIKIKVWVKDEVNV
jgi:hypothetical protein